MVGVVPFRRAEGPTATSDAVLMSRCARGDKHAMAQLFDAYHADVHRFVSRVAPFGAADVDDIVQTTFLAALRGAASYDGSASARAWILGVAANTVRHHKRSFLRRMRLSAALAWEPRPATTSPESRIAATDALASLEVGLKMLSPPLREVFVLCQIEGVPCTEAAAALELPVGTIYRRMHSARQALRAHLAEGGA